MDKEPKERIVYDEAGYDEDFLREQLEERYVTFGDMDELNDDFVNENWFLLNDYRQTDYDEEIGDLTAFFDGGERMMSSFENPLAGNPVIVSGVIGRWDGERRGYSPFKSFEEAIDTSPSRFGLGNPLADCEIRKVWDENGHLFVHGAHHDGSVTVEVRQLTDDGAAALAAIEDAWVGDEFTIAGKTYDGSAQSTMDALDDLWENPDLCPAPRYMELVIGCPAEEWEEPTLDPLLGIAEFTPSAIMSAEVATGTVGATVRDVSGTPYTVPEDVLNGLKDIVRDADRAGTISPSAALTIAGWNQKGDETRWALDFENKNGFPPQLSDYLARDAKGDAETVSAAPVSLKSAAKEARAASEALAAHETAPGADLEHEAEAARKASKALSDNNPAH